MIVSCVAVFDGGIIDFLIDRSGVPLGWRSNFVQLKSEPGLRE